MFKSRYEQSTVVWCLCSAKLLITHSFYSGSSSLMAVTPDVTLGLNTLITPALQSPDSRKECRKKGAKDSSQLSIKEGLPLEADTRYIWLWLSGQNLVTWPNVAALENAAAAAAKSLQSCPTPCDPIDGSPPGSPVPGILQARTLEWAAISFSNAGKWKMEVKLLSHVQLLATPWTAAHQASLSMGFPRQEYRSGLPLPSPGEW